MIRLPLVCLLIISLLAISASASSYVWCVSADGDHSALEFAPTGDCSQDDCTPTTDRGAASALSAEGADCGPCLDIASVHQWNVSRSRQTDASIAISAALPPALLTAFTPLPARTLNSHRLIDLPPRIHDPILHHRSIVLLI